MRKWLISICLVFMVSICFAIPGVTDSWGKGDGEYVFYRDYSFPRETYIGFLEYSDGTVAIRYYAKNPEVGLDDITLYVSLNLESDFIDMVGEKIIGDVTAEDTETLNYLHDLLYELAGRRKKLNDRDFASTLRVNQEYVQFGGDVTMVYDFYIPLFNLNRIVDKNGDVLFEAVTFGSISDATDTSFSDFKGFSNLPNFEAKDKKKNLSKSWTSLQGSEDMKFIGEDAIAYTIFMDFEYNNESFANGDWFNSIVKSSVGSFGDLQVYGPSISLSESKKVKVMKYLTYEKGSNLYAFNIIVFTQEEETLYKMQNYSIFGDFYYENKKYFDGLCK